METIEDWIDELKNSNKTILVEGKKDQIALNNLGINNIITLKQKPIYKVVEEISENSKEVIILTDLDAEGRKLYSKLKYGLQKHGIKIDNKFREFLFKKIKISQIEGIEIVH